VSRPITAYDVLVPAAVLAVATAEAAGSGLRDWGAAVAVQAVVAVLLVWRRRFPLVLCTTAGLVLGSLPWYGPQLDDLASPILFVAVIGYGLARWIADLRGLVGIAAQLVIYLVTYVVVDARSHDITDFVFVLSLFVPPYVVGRVTRRMADQSEQIALQSEQLRDQAVRDERDRIARELHDVIAHSISAMVVQTAAAQDLVRSSPDRALTMLDSVAETGRRALSETGRLLHLIRDESDELGLSPAPGVADLPALVEEFRTAGLDVDGRLRLPDEPLTGSVDVSAYRLVQEALTNALKYADGAASLVVEADGGSLRIRCANRVGPGTGTGSGLGLTGMAERVAMLGGSLTHGRAGDRFEVDAVIPLPAAVAQ
jgi:signal transduction histidine kinase